MNKITVLFLTGACLLAACSTTEQDAIRGAFVTPTQDGTFNANLVEVQTAVIDNTVSFTAGRQEGVGLRAYAGIVPDQPTQTSLVGDATFRGPYSIANISDIKINDNFVTGRNAIINGEITLTTDLSTMTLTGTDKVLTVRGRIADDQRLTGEIEAFGVTGTLQGEIGTDRAFAAFHGQNATNLIAGGFVTTVQP